MMLEFRRVSFQNSPQKPPVLRDANFCVAGGEWVFLVGPPQSGKSTIFRLLLAQMRATSGQIFFDGREITAISEGQIPYLRRKIGFVGAQWPLVEHLNAAQNLELCLRAAGATNGEIERKIGETLRDVEFSDSPQTPARELDAQAQLRLCLARAVILRPLILVLDDAARELAPARAWAIYETLAKLWQTHGFAVLMATHDAAFVDEAGARVLRLAAGEIESDIENGVFDPNESQRQRAQRRLEFLEFSPPVERLLKHHKNDF